METFEVLWRAYPRKQSRQSALMAFLSLDLETQPELVQAIVAHVTARARTDEWRDVRFIPMLDRFLFDRRWEDEIIQGRAQDTANEDYWAAKLREAEARGWKV